MSKRLVVVLVVGWIGVFCAGEASAQIYEAAGSRAPGMGGAFVAVASDSSATWWNPAGLADGPFVDVGLARGLTEQTERTPAFRDRASSFALGTPVIGISYYRFEVTDTLSAATGPAPANREDITAGLSIRSLTVQQFGVTLVQTLLPGVHVGATFNYVTGTGRTGTGMSADPDSLLEAGEELEGGDREHHFDLTLGALATAGIVRLGVAMRNVTAPEFGDGVWRLPRQVRVGAALDLEKAGGPPLIVAVDADALTYRAGAGNRRVIAVGGEQWLLARRLGIRAGARFNQVGDSGRAFTGGASVAVRAGAYLEGYVVHGGDRDEQGWGAAARVSF